MKKILLLSSLLLLMIVGCKNPSSSDSVSSSTSEDKFQLEVRERLQALEGIKFTETRHSYSIKKDNVTYYDSYEVSYFDEKNNYESKLITINKYNDFSTPEGSSTIVKTIYYDGFYSYTSQEDGVYLKESCKRSLGLYELGFDFERCDSFEIKDNQTMIGVVSEMNVSSFYGKELSGVTDFTVTIIGTQNDLQEISMSYTKQGYSIKESIKYSDNPHMISLPKLVKNA